jgi:Tfp pilus assembly protein PilE
MMLELLAAMVVLTVAILALMAGYDSAFMSMHKAARTTSASTLAQNQLEIYSAIYANSLGYASIGLDTTTLSAVKATNTTYTSDEAALTDAATAHDYTWSCGTATNCLPVQTLTGSDHKSYTVETFTRDVPSTAYTGRNERVVTVIVRDPNTSGSPVVAQMDAAFDAGP